MTRDQAARAVAAVTAERDGIQANLLDLDGSFGKRLLAGAVLAGETRARWESAAAELARLWETYSAYAGVIDRAERLLARVRKASAPELAEITALMTGPSVQLARAPAALAARDLTAPRQAQLTLTMAVREMKLSFARAAGVITAAESVWNVLAAGLEEIGAGLTGVRRAAGDLVAPGAAAESSAAAAALLAAESELGRQRAALNADPLAFWISGRVDASHLNLLGQEARAAITGVSELIQLRAEAEQRIAAVAAAVAAAQDAARDAARARARAAEKIDAAALPPALPEIAGPPGIAGPPEIAALTGQLTSLEQLKAAGRWARLGAELDAVGQQAADARQRFRDSERESAGLLQRRDELRGLLDAYQAKAARLGGAEDSELTARHDRARDLLWTAPCDLAAAQDAVARYQDAILALSRPGPRQVSP
ncbi:MAG TPA: hypothetical protein VGH88_12725 [Streptosporangiaceae bacterium]